MTSLIDDLRAITGPAGVLTEAGDQEPYTTDWRNLWSAKPQAVVRPATTNEASAVIGLLRERRVPISLQGGNTGLVGGSIPDTDDAIILQTGRMVQPQTMDPDNYTIALGAGVTLEAAQALAEQHGLRIPLRLGSEGSAQIGGLIATNAGGSHAMRFGMMRAQVLGLEVVLPDGSVLDDRSRLTKNNFGPAWHQVFIGSEGQFGLITSAVLKLEPIPVGMATAVVSLREVTALRTLLNLARQRVGPALERMEFMSETGIQMALDHVRDVRFPFDERLEWVVLLEIAGSSPENATQDLMNVLAAAFEDGLISDAVPAASLNQTQSFWHLREAVVEGQRLYGPQLKHDVAVPVASLPEFLESATAKVSARFPNVVINPFGHAGDGNVHFNISTPDIDPERDSQLTALVYDVVCRFSGSVAAEHGVGRLKKDYYAAQLSDAKLTMVDVLKRGLDPHSLFNHQLLPRTGKEP